MLIEEKDKWLTLIRKAVQYQKASKDVEKAT
jgi:hypothetical protein